MIERQLSPDGAMRYCAELKGSLDGLKVSVLLLSEKEVAQAYLHVSLLDSSTGKQVAYGSFDLTPESIYRGDKLVPGVKLKWGDDRQVGEEEFEYRRAMSMLAVWFLQEFGIKRIRLGESLVIEGETMDEVDQIVGGWWQASRMEEFYEMGQIILRGGLRLEVDIRNDWERQAMIYTRLVSPDGDEGYLDLSLWREEDTSVSLAIDRWCVEGEEFWRKAKIKNEGLEEVEEEVSEVVVGVSDRKELVDSIQAYARQAMFYLTLRFLRQKHGRIRVFDYTEQVIRQVNVNEEELRQWTDYWLDF